MDLLPKNVGALTHGAVLLLALACPAQAVAQEPQPFKAVFIVARPDLPDSNFEKSVVLMVPQRAAGPIGVIINKSTGVPLSKVFPEITRLADSDQVLFFGGPVERSSVSMIFRSSAAPPGAIRILDGVYMSSDGGLMRKMLADGKASDDIRVFAGYAGWAPGQLESEVSRGDWRWADADAQTIFEKNFGTVWQDVGRRASDRTASRSMNRVSSRE